MRNTYRKHEHLKSRKTIQRLFSEGKSVAVHPVKLIYVEAERPGTGPVQTAFTVPKRNFKRAVDRNRLKRLMREAFRQNKNLLYPVVEMRGKQLAIMFLFTGREEVTYSEIQRKIIVTLERLRNEYEASA